MMPRRISSPITSSASSNPPTMREPDDPDLNEDYNRLPRAAWPTPPGHRQPVELFMLPPDLPESATIGRLRSIAGQWARMPRPDDLRAARAMLADPDADATLEEAAEDRNVDINMLAVCLRPDGTLTRFGELMLERSDGGNTVRHRRVSVEALRALRDARRAVPAVTLANLARMLGMNVGVANTYMHSDGNLTLAGEQLMMAERGHEFAPIHSIDLVAVCDLLRRHPGIPTMEALARRYNVRFTSLSALVLRDGRINGRAMSRHAGMCSLYAETLGPHSALARLGAHLPLAAPAPAVPSPSSRTSHRARGRPLASSYTSPTAPTPRTGLQLPLRPVPVRSAPALPRPGFPPLPFPFLPAPLLPRLSILPIRQTLPTVAPPVSTSVEARPPRTPSGTQEAISIGELPTPSDSKHRKS